MVVVVVLVVVRVALAAWGAVRRVCVDVGGGGGGVVGVQYGASCNKQANTNATQLLMLRPYTILQPNSLHHGPIVSHVNS